MRSNGLNILLWMMMAGLAQGCSTFRDEETAGTPYKQMMCLAEAIHGEARGESEEGKIFVGRVIVTRVKNGYGKNYCDVVYSKRQFAPKKRPQQASVKAAKKSLQLGANGVTHFHSYEKQRSANAGFSIAPHCVARGKVGGHWGFTCHEHGIRKTASTVDD